MSFYFGLHLYNKKEWFTCSQRALLELEEQKCLLAYSDHQIGPGDAAKHPAQILI